MAFPKLRYMQLRNASMAAEQVADFVSAHRRIVREFDFDNVFLTNSGTWEEALAPLSESEAESNASEEWTTQPNSDVDSTSSLENVRSREAFDHIIEIGCEVPSGPVDDMVAPPVSLTKLKKHRRRRKRKHNHVVGHLEISSPILGTFPEAIETLDTLEPTVFDPNVQGVQRDFRQEAAQRELVDDPDKRVMMLQRAKEAVLRQLGKSYDKKSRTELLKNTCSGAWRSKGFIGNDSNSTLVPLMFSRY